MLTQGFGNSVALCTYRNHKRINKKHKQQRSRSVSHKQMGESGLPHNFQNCRGGIFKVFIFLFNVRSFLKINLHKQLLLSFIFSKTNPKLKNFMRHWCRCMCSFLRASVQSIRHFPPTIMSQTLKWEARVSTLDGDERCMEDALTPPLSVSPQPECLYRPSEKILWTNLSTKTFFEVRQTSGFKTIICMSNIGHAFFFFFFRETAGTFDTAEPQVWSVDLVGPLWLTVS